MVMFRWITPKPPSCARAIAISASVTVSIAELMIGMFILKFLEIWVVVSTSFGSTDDTDGSIKKSSKVYPMGALFNFSENI